MPPDAGGMVPASRSNGAPRGCDSPTTEVGGVLGTPCQVHIDLGEDQARFFRVLVRFNQAELPDVGQSAHDQLASLNRTPKTLLGKDQLECYPSWHNPVVRGLSGKHRLDSAEAIARANVVGLTLPQVKLALRLLDRLVLVQTDPVGSTRPTAKVIQADPALGRELLPQLQAPYLELAREAFTKDGPVDRLFWSSTLSFSGEAQDHGRGAWTRGGAAPTFAADRLDPGDGHGTCQECGFLGAVRIRLVCVACNGQRLDAGGFIQPNVLHVCGQTGRHGGPGRDRFQVETVESGRKMSSKGRDFESRRDHRASLDCPWRHTAHEPGYGHGQLHGSHGPVGFLPRTVSVCAMVGSDGTWVKLPKYLFPEESATSDMTRLIKCWGPSDSWSDWSKCLPDRSMGGLAITHFGDLVLVSKPGRSIPRAAATSRQFIYRGDGLAVPGVLAWQGCGVFPSGTDLLGICPSP